VPLAAIADAPEVLLAKKAMGGFHSVGGFRRGCERGVPGVRLVMGRTSAEHFLQLDPDFMQLPTFALPMSALAPSPAPTAQPLQ
jgi:hypothetical protein